MPSVLFKIKVSTNILFCIIILTLIFGSAGILKAQNHFFIQESKVNFESDAPLEIIKAESHDLRGVIDIESHKFGFSVATLSFRGFNSQLQRSHFNENYMESESYPEITFSGKIIDDIDFKIPGIYNVRAKGTLMVKGISQERIIRSTVEVKSSSIELKSDFNVLLSDHEIRIPRIVNQKIASVIKVNVAAVFQLQKNN